jgi:hypothetical protein
MMEQKPRGIPEEVPAEATEEIKEAPSSMIGEEPVLEELRPVVDKSEVAHPLKKRRAWYYWTS